MLRAALIDRAAQLVADHGSGGLTLRRLTSDLGVSTMAVYTHFGSMDDLGVALREEGFIRLAHHLDAVQHSRDPLYDLGMLGWAYCQNALANPNLYRVMFMAGDEPAGREIGYETFERLILAVDRVMKAGKFTPGDATARAAQLWALTHGAVSLNLADLLTFDETQETLLGGASALFIGCGGEPTAVGRSIDRMRRALRTVGPKR